MKKTWLRSFVCLVCTLAMLFAAAAPAAFAAAGSEPQAEGKITSGEAQQMQQADEAVAALTGSEEYGDMTVAARTQAAVEQLEQLAAQGLVRAGSIYADEANGMVSFAYSCGVLGGILVDDSENDDSEQFAVQPAAQEQAQKVSLRQENGLLESLSGRYQFLGNAVIYYAFDDLINSSRYPYYAYMQAYWTTLGFTTKLDTKVTVNTLRHMDDYDLCVFSAHGAYYTYNAGYFSDNWVTEPVILLLEETTPFKDMLYGLDLLSRHVIKINGYYCVTPSFFSSTYRNGELSGKVIVSETCEFLGVSGEENYSMAEALLSAGAEAVVGYVNNVYAVYARSMLWDIVNHLILGDTVQRAVEHAQGLYGETDLVWYNTRGGQRPHSKAAYAVISGSKDARLLEMVQAAA